MEVEELEPRTRDEKTVYKCSGGYGALYFERRNDTAVLVQVDPYDYVFESLKHQLPKSVTLLLENYPDLKAVRVRGGEELGRIYTSEHVPDTPKVYNLRRLSAEWKSARTALESPLFIVTTEDTDGRAVTLLFEVRDSELIYRGYDEERSPDFDEHVDGVFLGAAREVLFKTSGPNRIIAGEDSKFPHGQELLSYESKAEQYCDSLDSESPGEFPFVVGETLGD